MKVFLINEPFIKDFCRTQRWAARTRARVLRPPEWLAYATAVLEKAGHSVKLYDFPAHHWEKKHLIRIIKAGQPDFVVLDSTTPSIYSDLGCARMIKEHSRAKVIMVGPHASALPEETLKAGRKNVDVICMGEYDYSIRDVVENFSRLEHIPGICYWKNENPQKTPPRPFIENLDSLPYPAWHHLNIMDYYTGMRLYPFYNIFSGRGCPYQCIFCLWPQVMHGRKYRLRSPSRVVDEMEWALNQFPKLKFGEFFFEDDTFTAVKQHAVAICKEILKRNLKLTFSCNVRADLTDFKLLRLLKRAGCRVLWVGYESGDQDILDTIKKKITLEQAREFTELSKKAGLWPHGCFVIGLPGETKQTMQKTIDFALKLKLPSLQFSAIVPFPGTEHFRMCEQQGTLKTKQWDQWLPGGEQGTVVEYPGLSSVLINRTVDKALQKFYFRPSYIFTFLTKTKNIYDFYRKAKGGVNFTIYLIKNYLSPF
jgi:anaerobic magnesium-protoporphyrin IX monomethyl ester cyclase